MEEQEIMNELQLNNVISDLCVTASEVGDSGKAVSWLNLNGDLGYY
jgi:hypothetical protein